VPLVGERRATLVLLLILCLAFSLFSSNIAFASLENWVEVARFNGSREITTDYFTCDHVEWRIRYEFYYDHTHWPTFPHFRVTVYSHEGNYSEKIDFISVNGTEERNGTVYINSNGEFYLEIVPLNIVTRYAVIVEQNLESSIPEFPSWIILPLFVMATIAVVIYRNRLRREG